jgi:ParB-like chromosome segregation protein Spo0J
VKEALMVHEPVRVKVTELNFAKYNPRIMPAEEMSQLKASMRKHGLVLNLVVQKKNMTLIGGHQRVTGMRELCAELGVAPPEFAFATVLDVDDATAKQLNVALNKIGGVFDEFKLGELLKSLPPMSEADVTSIGFRQCEVDALIKAVAPPEELAGLLRGDVGELQSFGRVSTFTLDFETKEECDEVKNYIATRRGERGGKKIRPGTIVLGLVRMVTTGDRSPVSG